MGQLQAIKVGQRRIVLNNVYFVYESTNDLLVKNSDGSVRIGMPTDEFFSDIEVSVYFIDDSSIRFFADEARDFLRQFDALTGIEETVAVVEPVAEGSVDADTGAKFIEQLRWGERGKKVTLEHADLSHAELEGKREAAGNTLTTNAEPIAAMEMIWAADYIAKFTSDSISGLEDRQLIQFEEDLVMLKNSKISLVNPKHLDDLAWQVTREIVIRGLDKVTAKPDTASKVAAAETGTLRDALSSIPAAALEKLADALDMIIDSDAPVNVRSEARILRQSVKKEINQRFDYLKD